MSDEALLKQFYTKILRLLQAKQPDSAQMADIVSSFQEYTGRSAPSAALVKLGLPEVHALIEALSGQGASAIDTAGIDGQQILQNYLQRLFPMLQASLAKMQQQNLPATTRESLGLLEKQLRLIESLLSQVLASHCLEMIQQLICAYTDFHGEWRKPISETLKTIGQPVILALVHELYAAEAVGDLPELLKEMGYPAIPALIVALHYPEERVRLTSAHVLEKIRAREAVPSLLEALQDPSWQVRQAVASALGKIGAPRAVPGLIAALRDERVEVRQEIVRALGKTRTVDVLPALLPMLQDASWEVRREAVESMAQFGPAASNFLALALANDSLVVRKIASRELAELGTDSCLPALLKAMYDKDISVREKVVTALGRLEGEASLQALIYALEDRAPLVRFAAVQALATIGDKKIIHLLNKVREDPEPLIRQRVEMAIGAIRAQERQNPSAHIGK